ncbi:hypothetical protein [Polaromonas sp.]|jgi:hypothetical protein|nr:hypothetical protein [Polaromonas sp.]
MNLQELELVYPLVGTLPESNAQALFLASIDKLLAQDGIYRFSAA